MDYAKEKGSLLVEFYAPWCIDCKNLAPEWDKASDKLGSRGSDMAKIDCFGAGECTCKKYNVKSWPQIKTFRHGVYTGEYVGEQTGEEMAKYVSYAGATADYVDEALRGQAVDSCSQRSTTPEPEDDKKRRRCEERRRKEEG